MWINNLSYRQSSLVLHKHIYTSTIEERFKIQTIMLNLLFAVQFQLTLYLNIRNKMFIFHRYSYNLFGLHSKLSCSGVKQLTQNKLWKCDVIIQSKMCPLLLRVSSWFRIRSFKNNSTAFVQITRISRLRGMHAMMGNDQMFLFQRY